VADDRRWPNRDPDDVRSTAPIPADRPPLSTEYRTGENELAEEILAAGTAPHRALSPAKRFVGRVLMITGGVLALGVVLYTIDLMTSAGDVPRGVVVSGVDVGGMSQADAEAKLRRELASRLAQPVLLSAGDVRATLDPLASGLGVDWPSTLAQAGHQPLDPVARVESFFVKRQVDVVTRTDQKALEQAVSQLAQTRLNHPATEGDIGFRPIPGSDGGVSAFAVEPRDGQTLTDVTGAADLIKSRWLDRTSIQLPVDYAPVLATSQGVHATLDQFVTPAISGPVALHGDGADAVLKPSGIAAALRFAPRSDGMLQASLDPATLQQSLAPELTPTERAGKDAQIVFTGDVPVVQPSEDARKIDWSATFAPLTAVLVEPDGRDLTVRYRTSRPQLTTEDADGLGIREVVGEFTTGGLSGADGVNARTLANKVNGAVLRPGQTFSLTDRTGPWTAAQGYLPAPVNEDGTGAQVIAGGVSQLATTLYNAVYWAGLADAGHSEHGYYLDRYVPGRDAKSMADDGSAVDVRFTDSLTSGVAIQAFSTGDSLTVRIWGTRQYRVEGFTSGWRDIVAPPVQRSSGPSCRPFAGEPGFSVTDTRIRYDLATGVELGRDTRDVSYAPKPAVSCT